MQLLIQRSQRQGGMLGGKTVFILGIRAQYTEEERANINRYKLGGQTIYDSKAAQEHLDNMDRHAATGTWRGVVKGIGSLALAKMNLSVTLSSLQRGHTVECRDLGELLECQTALVEACKNVKHWLEAADTFDGREILVDLDEDVAA